MELGVEDREAQRPKGAVDCDHPLAELVAMEWALREQPEKGELEGFTT